MWEINRAKYGYIKIAVKMMYHRKAINKKIWWGMKKRWTKTKPLTQLEREKNSYNQQQLYNLWGPLQKEQTEVLVQSLLKISRWQQQSIKPSMRPSQCGVHVTAQVSCPRSQPWWWRCEFVSKMRNRDKYINSDYSLGIFKGLGKKILEDMVKGIRLRKYQGIGRKE